MLESDWQPSPVPKVLCHHHWVTVSKDESQPGMRIITQQCPSCGKQRVLPRRVLPELPKKKYERRSPKGSCHHIWVQDKSEENLDKTMRRLTHTCPKCGITKTTHRRMLPPV